MPTTDRPFDRYGPWPIPSGDPTVVDPYAVVPMTIRKLDPLRMRAEAAALARIARTRPSGRRVGQPAKKAGPRSTSTVVGHGWTFQEPATTAWFPSREMCAIAGQAPTPTGKPKQGGAAEAKSSNVKLCSENPDGGPMAALRTKIMGMIRRPNWDGLGGKSVSSATCQAAAWFVQGMVDHRIPEPTFVGPSALGAIAFQWNIPMRRLKVRVFSNSRDGCEFQWIELPNSVEKGHGDINTVVARLAKFFA